MQKIDGTNVNLRITTEQAQKIDAIAARFKISKAETMRKIIDTGLDAYEAYEAVGLVTIADLVKRTKEAVRRSRQPKLI